MLRPHRAPLTARRRTLGRAGVDMAVADAASDLARRFFVLPEEAKVVLGLGRIVALYHRSSTSYHIH
jgi:hypothetical protein